MNVKMFVKNHPEINPKRVFSPGVFRAITSPLRILPDFLIIGASKSGTTSLYEYLVQHPCVHPPRSKELHYFDNKETGWYRSNFPTIFSKFNFKFFKCLQ